MATIRYGARSLEQLRNREVEATSTPIWATSLVATYETDPELVAAVLPPPLEAPAEPLVRVTIATVDMGPQIGVFGAGTVSVHCRHEGLDGDYALVMPMTTEQAVVGGRETFGEPKKLAEVTIERNGDQVIGKFTRLGVTFVEVTGRVTGALDLTPDRRRTSFYFKFLPSPTGKGFDGEPSLIYCHRDETTRKLENVAGEVILRESRFDPVADLPVRTLRSIELAERSSIQIGEFKTFVPGDWIQPFVHQRYDDLSPVGSD